MSKKIKILKFEKPLQQHRNTARKEDKTMAYVNMLQGDRAPPERENLNSATREERKSAVNKFLKNEFYGGDLFIDGVYYCNVCNWLNYNNCIELAGCPVCGQEVRVLSIFVERKVLGHAKTILEIRAS